MATINEIIQSAVDRVKLKGSETWIKWSFWTRAKDVELNSGKNVETAVSELDENISNEIDRATDRENEIETALNSEITRAKSAESTLSTSINNEITRAKNTENTLETNKVPITRTINGKALSSNITLSASDVGADASGSANTALTNAKAYTDKKVADLVGTAPETLDTLEELADALKDNADIVDVLNESITSKASAVDLTSHASNNTVHITADERTAWNAKASKYEWTAKIKGQTWSRIFQVKTSVSVIGNSGILNVSFTRGNVVCNATFMITTSHKNKCFITQLSANSYSPFKIRGVANTHGDAYIELYDYTASISTDTEQAVYCRFIPLRVNTVNVYTEFVDGTTVPTDYTANDPLTVDITGGSMVASKFVGDLAGNATSSDKLATARKIGKASFDGSGDVSLADIMGRAETTSSVGHAGHYTKFATIDISAGGWIGCAGTLEFLRIEAPTVVGRLQYTFRSQSSITDTYISLYWETISDIKYAETVIATKVSDGVFDLYYKPLDGYDSMTITNTNTGTNSNNPELLTLYSQQEYVKSLENIVYVSKISAMATQLTTSAGTATSAGSATQPVYFSGGKPVACTYTLGKSVPSNAVFTDTTYSTGTASSSGLTKLYAGTGTATDGSMTQSAITTELGKYLPLAGGSVSGNIIPSTTNNSLILGSSTNRWGTVYTNNHDANYIHLRKYMILEEAPATPKIINYATYSQTVYSSGSANAETSTSTVEFGASQSYSYGTYYNLDTVLKGYRLRLNADSKMSTNVALAIASDEKVKSFTTDIDTDEEKLVKLFDIIKPKSYSYKYVKSDNSNSLNIGFSAQEIEQAMIDLGIDPEKYGILNIQYGHMLSRGSDFEDGKYYTKFYEISYNDLFNLSLLKTHMMEKEHVERLVALEEKASKLDELEARLSALENK